MIAFAAMVELDVEEDKEDVGQSEEYVEEK
jgi:hypothetical protein